MNGAQSVSRIAGAKTLRKGFPATFSLRLFFLPRVLLTCRQRVSPSSPLLLSLLSSPLLSSPLLLSLLSSPLLLSLLSSPPLVVSPLVVSPLVVFFPVLYLFACRVIGLTHPINVWDCCLTLRLWNPARRALPEPRIVIHDLQLVPIDKALAHTLVASRHRPIFKMHENPLELLRSTSCLLYHVDTLYTTRAEKLFEYTLHERFVDIREHTRYANTWF